MRNLTKRQAEVLAYISRFMNENGYPPTVREVAHHLNLSGPRGAVKHLEALERKGRIRRVPGISRGLEIVGMLPSPTYGVKALETPIVGRVAAGPLDFAAEDMEGSLVLDENLAGEGTFLLRVKGDSMSGDHIVPGDMALVRPQVTAENGDLVVVAVDGDATLKRYRRLGDTVVLEASNPEYAPITLTAENTGEVRIVGRVEAVIRLLRGRKTP